jgi:hypothetical protein
VRCFCIRGAALSSTENMNDSGTSIGAFVGGLYAREGDIIFSASRAKQFSGRMGNIWRVLSDVTYPIVAYTTVICVFYHQCTISNLSGIQGHEFNRSLYKVSYLRNIHHHRNSDLCLAGLLRSSHRRYVAPLLLQHNQHQHLPHGNS